MRAARILMVGATLGMTIGLATSGLTAAAEEPPTAPAPPLSEPVAQTTPPATDTPAPATPTTQPVTEDTQPAAQPEVENAPPIAAELSTPPSSDSDPEIT